MSTHVPTEGRENNFDFLRFFLAALVIFSHCYAVLGYKTRPLSEFSHNQATLGDIAVNGFFVLSGFLITSSWLRSKSFSNYIKKRVLRIFPGFIVAALIGVFVVGLLGADSRPAYLHELPPLLSRVLTSIVMLKSNIPQPPTLLHIPQGNIVNGSLWTIRIEFQCYLLVALLAFVGVYKHRMGTLWLFVALLILYGIEHERAALIVKSSREFEIVRHLRLYTYFVAGMAFYIYREKIVFSVPLFIGSLLLSIAIIMTRGLGFGLPIFGSYALLYVAFSRHFRAQHFGRYGDVSYGVYLYGWPVQQMLVFYGGIHWNPFVFFLATLMITTLLATLSWFLVEKPCLRLKSRRNAPALSAENSEAKQSASDVP